MQSLSDRELKTNKADKKRIGWKRRLVHELTVYWTNVLYLVFFFSLLTWYRRMLAALYDISYVDYGVNLFEALVLAKVIMLGDVLRLGRGFEAKPLVLPTLYKAVVFTLWVWVFGILEHTVKGFLDGKGLAGGLDVLLSKDREELLARCLITFLAFIPFFAFKEIGRVLGEGKMLDLFFRKGPAAQLPDLVRSKGEEKAGG